MPTEINSPLGRWPDARNYPGPTSWRWRLTDADGGRLLADHSARLDSTCWQIEGALLRCWGAGQAEAG